MSKTVVSNYQNENGHIEDNQSKNGHAFKTEQEEILFVSFVKDGSISDILIPNPRNRLSEKNRSHINSLKESLTKHGYNKNIPIPVNDDFVQQGGHHRRQAIMEIEKSGNFGMYKGFWIKIVDEKTENAFRERTQMEDLHKKWSSMDCILYFANGGNEEYIKIKEFMDHYGFRIKVNQMLMADIGHQAESSMLNSLKNGTFVVKNWDVVRAKADYLVQIQNVIQTKLIVTCAAAILGFFKVDGFKPDRLLRVLKEHQGDFVQQRTEEANRQLLEKYYNLRLRNDHRLKLTLK